MSMQLQTACSFDYQAVNKGESNMVEPESPGRLLLPGLLVKRVRLAKPIPSLRHATLVSMARFNAYRQARCMQGPSDDAPAIFWGATQVALSLTSCSSRPTDRNVRRSAR